jgi:hypothetical protein
LQPSDFGLPNRLSQDRLSEICDGFGISNRTAAQMRERLDLIINAMRDWMSQEPKPGGAAKDRERIDKISGRIAAALLELQGLGTEGRDALRSIAHPIGSMLSADWIRQRFPDDDVAPPPAFNSSMRSPMHSPERNPERGPPPEPEDTYPKFLFVEYRAQQTLTAILRELNSCLATPRKTLARDLGGRRPLKHRHYLILNLAALWHSIERTVLTSPNSDFAVFCQAIFEAIGWPTRGLNATIPAVLREWRYRQQKNGQLSK